jgi:uncharacterized protein YdeI (YjbR/CyaY-like superfamily)
MNKKTNSQGDPDIEARLQERDTWREEFLKLRAIVLSCSLKEEWKWGQPCYSDEGRNVVLIHGFKDYCALLFFKGALMKDRRGLLIQQTENVRSGRQIRFANLGEIVAIEAELKAYVLEAIEIERAGLKVEPRKPSDLQLPAELTAIFDADPQLKDGFFALTPGRQRAYVLHFSAPKQAKTRESRIEKCAERILAGKGLDD